MPLSLDCKYFLIPSSWISKWRNYVNPTVKNSDTPETLNPVIGSLMCEKVHCLFISSLIMFCILLCGINEFPFFQYSVRSIWLNLNLLFRLALI
jgi:hypothetical protein